MNDRRYPIVVVRCKACGVEVVGKLRNGRVYATNAAKPENPQEVEGYCAAHGRLYVPMSVER